MIARTYALTTATVPVGLYASNDLGITWVNLDPTGVSLVDFGGSNVGDVAANPYDTNQVLIGGASGIRRSTDGGLTFTTVSSASVNYLFYRSSTSIIAGGVDLVRSNDSGATFTNFPDTPASLLPEADSATVRVTAIHFSNFSGGFIAVSGESLATGERISRIHRTINGGGEWVNSILLNYAVVSLATNVYEGILTYMTNTYECYTIDDSLLEDPVLRYTAPGALPTSGNNSGEIRQVVGDPSKLYGVFPNSGEVIYSLNSGQSWVLVNTLPSITAYPRIFAYDENTVIILTQITADAVTLRSTDGGATFNNSFVESAGRPAGLDSSIPYDCGECPPGFTLNESTNQCESQPLGGPLCDPPYFFDVITQQCALPDSSTAVNVTLAIDISGSVNSEERVQYIIFLRRLIDELLERLATGNTQMSIVLWNEQACLQQDFTTDPVLLKNAINAVATVSIPELGIGVPPPLACPGMSKSSGTYHALGLCEGIRSLHTAATARPAAENFFVMVTDGTYVGGPCDLTDLGYTTVIPANTTTDVCLLLKLAEEIKADLAGKPATFMFLAIGDSGERQALEQDFKNNAFCIGGPLSYPSANDDGDLYYYDGGDFSQADDFAKQIVLGFGAQFVEAIGICPPGCEAVPGDDSGGYCACQDDLPFTPCNYELVDCLDGENIIVTDANLQTYFENNSIITLESTGNTCWRINQLDTISDNPVEVIVAEIFEECNTCALSFALRNCRDNTIVIYTIQEEFLPFIDPDRIVTVEEYPGECWTVTRNTEGDYTPEILTLDARSYDRCEDCVGNYFYLTSCSNEQSFIMTDTDLTEYIDETVSIAGYPGACFIVQREACNCISVRLFSKVSGLRTYRVERAPVLLNGKNQYIILTAQGERILIAFDIEENRWEVWNIDADTLLSYSIVTTDCPYTGIWENISEDDFRMISITSCETSIYTVEVDGTYLSCECCLFKNC